MRPATKIDQKLARIKVNDGGTTY